jgi:hypothetical protein
MGVEGRLHASEGAGGEHSRKHRVATHLHAGPEEGLEEPAGPSKGASKAEELLGDQEVGRGETKLPPEQSGAEGRGEAKSLSSVLVHQAIKPHKTQIRDSIDRSEAQGPFIHDLVQRLHISRHIGAKLTTPPREQTTETLKRRVSSRAVSL